MKRNRPPARDRNLGPRNCLYCGKGFQPKNRQHDYCCPKHKTLAYWKRQIEGRAA